MASLCFFLSPFLNGCGVIWSNVAYLNSPSRSPLIYDFQYSVSGKSTETYGIAQDTNRNTFISGFTTGMLGGNLYGTHGSSDAFVAMIDPYGNLVWVSQIGGTGTTSAYGMVVDASDNVYIAGLAQGYLGGTQYGTLGTKDAFVAKFNSAGVLQWASQFGEGVGANVIGSQLVLDNLNHIFIVGTTNTFLGGTQYGAHGNNDIFLMQFSTTGTFNWVSELSVAGGNANGISIAQYNSGNIYLSGYINGTIAGSALTGTHGTLDLLVTAFSSAGVYLWASQMNAAAGSTLGNAITLDATGNLFITGSTNVYLGGIQYGVHASDLFFTKYNSAGAFQWVNQLGQSAGKALVMDSGGGFLITGSTTASLGGVQYGTHGGTDLLLSKFDATGVLTWANQLGSGTTAVGQGISLNTLGTFNVSGYAVGTLGGLQLGALGTQNATASTFDDNGTLY